MEPYILIAVVAAVLYVWWRILHFTFDLIERAHAERVSQDDYGELYRLPLVDDEPIVGIDPSLYKRGRGSR